MVQNIRDEFQEWSDYLGEQFADLSYEQESARRTAARQRAVLIATAVLDGSPAESIFAAADSLLQQIGAEIHPIDFLAGPELAAIVSDLNLAQDGDSLSVSRRRHGVDLTILKRLWNQRPYLRGTIVNWLSEITAGSHPASRYVDRVSEALATLAVSERSLELLAIVEGWLDSKGRGQRRKLAIDILERLAVESDIGSAVRQRLYKLANTRTASPGVHSAVAEICGGGFGVLYPGAALVRLRLIAGHTDSPEVVNVVAAAFRQLFLGQSSKAEMMSVAVAWASDSDMRTRRAGRLALLALLAISVQNPAVDSVLEEARSLPKLAEDLVSAWRVLLGDDEVRPEAVVIAVEWLEAADNKALPSQLVVETLGPAIRDHIAASGMRFIFRGDNESPTRDKLLSQIMGRSIGGTSNDVGMGL
ncbi:hypothetical protein ABGB07_20700 [Micromonosporaceae bacterium B7E4]